MKNKILLGTLLPSLLILVLHLGMIYALYYALDGNLRTAQPWSYLVGILIVLSLAVFLWKILRTYRDSLQYLKTADRLKIDLKWSPQAVSSSSVSMNKYDFEHAFEGGICGEGVIEWESNRFKIVHQYRSTLFFPTFSGEKLVTVMSCTYNENIENFLLRPKLVGLNSAFCLDSSTLKGWEYFFYDRVRNENRELPSDIEAKLPAELTKQLERLPGKNVLLISNSKLAVIHMGFLKTVDDISNICSALSKMIAKKS